MSAFPINLTSIEAFDKGRPDGEEINRSLKDTFKSWMKIEKGRPDGEKNKR